MSFFWSACHRLFPSSLGEHRFSPSRPFALQGDFPTDLHLELLCPNPSSPSLHPQNRVVELQLLLRSIFYLQIYKYVLSADAPQIMALDVSFQWFVVGPYVIGFTPPPILHTLPLPLAYPPRYYPWPSLDPTLAIPNLLSQPSYPAVANRSRPSYPTLPSIPPSYPIFHPTVCSIPSIPPFRPYPLIVIA